MGRLYKLTDVVLKKSIIERVTFEERKFNFFNFSPLSGHMTTHEANTTTETRL